MEKICPVCGYDGLDEPPYRNYNGGVPSYEVCECCGFEFGFHDSNNGLTFEKYREHWIANGHDYYNEQKKPIYWNKENMKSQLENLAGLKYKPRV